MRNKFAVLGAVISLVLIVMSSLSWAAVFTDGLVVYLPFDEGKGEKAEDASGNKNHVPIWFDFKYLLVLLV